MMGQFEFEFTVAPCLDHIKMPPPPAFREKLKKKSDPPVLRFYSFFICE